MKLVSFAACLALLPSLAAAQNRGIFIQAGPALNIVAESDLGPIVGGVLSVTVDGVPVEATSRPTDDLSTSSSDGGRLGAALGIGVFVTPKVSLRIEGAFSGDRVDTTTVTSARARTALTSVNRMRSTDLTVSAAWHHGGDRRVGVNYLAGMVFSRTRLSSSYSFTYRTTTVDFVGGRLVERDGEQVIDEDEFETTSFGSGVLVGIDVPIRLAPRWSMVPQFRMSSAGRSWNMRPALTLRWQP